MKKLPIILICGGSCSGKSIFAGLFKNSLVLSMDHFYFGKSQMKPDQDGNYNFDKPESVDIKAYAQAIKGLANQQPVTIPLYDMKLSERTGKQIIKIKANTRFIIAEGIFSFYSPLKEYADLKIFLDIPTEIRVARRMVRDTEKGRSHIDTLAWSITVEKNHERYIEPMKKYADVIIPFSYNPVQFLK